MHPRGNKIYRDIRELYWWPGLKREVTDFVARCLTCQQKLHEALGSRLDFSIAFHPQIDSERRILGPELVSETEDKVHMIRDRLKTTSDKQKSYADLKRKDIEYSVGDMLELPPELDRIHDVFHVLMLRRYLSDPTHIVLVEEIEVRLDLAFEEEPVQILDRDVKILRRKSIPLVKVL
ncbi:uncharacterized protein [Gossypium hirsutum]|uniref:Integrase zinc-binding domain-containing protein n=1 Tax=Gossypium hirsutum TaxID=3635 RepID=A0A1U8N1W2_GOSHI|nr:uncharacterized protein LOC107943754 [Gossypium hirsutum]